MKKNQSNEDAFDFFSNCPDVRNGGKYDCDGDNCGCPEDGETVCIMGICVCMHQRHLAFDQINCIDPNHASILRNISHHDLKCPTTCIALSENNSCPPSSIRDKNGRCYCADGTRVTPNFTNDYTLDLPLDVCLYSPFVLQGNVTNEHRHNSLNGSLSFKKEPTNFVISTTFWLYLIIPVSLLLIFSSILIVICIKFLRTNNSQSFVGCVNIIKRQRDTNRNDYSSNNRNTSTKNSNMWQTSDGKVLLPSYLEDNPAYFSTTQLLKSESLKTSNMFENNFISNHKIKKGTRIGNGHFGEVYKGTYNSSYGPQEVAIKIPKVTWFGCCSPCEVESLKSFFAEAEITLGFEHQNVLSCLGISIGPIGEPWMIVEFMRYGDLANVLRTNSGVLSLQSSDSPTLEMIDLLRISYQIAVGMQYLTTQHFTHRDLAARNCLIGENFLVKISDFGLTRDIYSNEYYKIFGTEKLLPIRWMAPESITYGKFTHETDVWSYGVLLWEIFTFGKVPYYLLSNKEVMEAVSLGQHLDPPEGCPNVVKHLMLSCWELIPNNRITFSDIVYSLSEDNTDNMMGYSRLLYYNKSKKLKNETE